MENKLQELTRKLYDEGLSKGREEADKLVADAKAEAKRIVSQAQLEAERIRREAEDKAEDLNKNTMTELGIAAGQVTAKLRESIRDMIVAKAIDGSVTKANLDPEFIKQVLVEVAKNWTGSSSEKVTLKAMLPARLQDELGQAFEQSVHKILGDGMELVWSDGVKSGFKVGPKDGGYYISFSDEGFTALLGEYLRPKVSDMLFGKEE